MKFKVGIYYQNKTRKYLLPVVKGYGQQLIQKLSALSKIAVGVNDAVIPENMNLDNHVFILVNTNIKKDTFINVLTWLKDKDYFKLHYSFDDIVDGYQEMLVIKLPENHKGTHDHFINSEFSKMYTKETINKYFKKDDIRYGVLVRSDNATKSFVDKINKEHYTDLKYEEFTDEIEFFIKEEEEIFNYNLIHKYETRRKRSLTECSEKN